MKKLVEANEAVGISELRQWQGEGEVKEVGGSNLRSISGVIRYLEVYEGFGELGGLIRKEDQGFGSVNGGGHLKSPVVLGTQSLPVTGHTPMFSFAPYSPFILPDASPEWRQTPHASVAAATAKPRSPC